MRLLNENFRINIQLRDIIPNFVLLKKWGIKLEEAYLFSDTESTKPFIYGDLRRLGCTKVVHRISFKH